MTSTMTTKTTTEGSKFISNRFSEINTAEKWIAAFPERYASLPAKVAKSFALRDLNNAK
jgi:hypothetical protein